MTEKAPSGLSVTDLVSNHIRTWRKENRLPLKQAADQVGVSIAAFNAWESGHRFPSPDNLERIAAGLGMPVCRLFCQDDAACKNAESTPS